MLKKLVLLLLSGMLLVGSVSCNRYGCPANTEQQSSKKQKKSKSGVVPAGYAQKKGLRSR
ncbi:hypothetical protein C7N43_19055 [Sphingobacteriales bacterium UPWRP_1]|nr:hypothetical protein BVG80_02915 [Sphingobacteriales bacterium TSM_CSM]PSJ75435.1 hypothetical protein C7N43_19055 [Sphingobacteriales bacterium UPWRP_1]